MTSKQMESPELVTDQQRLETLCRDWRAAGRFAFDTEFIRDDTYDAQLCLIQVTLNGEVVLVDPTAGLDLDPFWGLVTDPAVLTIIHAGKEDFEVCLRAVGAPPRNVFDVQIAAGFVGLGYPLSLTRLVSTIARRRISKGQTLTDWLRRPLTEAQIRYAVEDVTYLPGIYEHLRKRLDESGRAAWVAEEFALLEKPETYQRQVKQRLFKLKGSRKLDGLGLAILERLIDWRDEWAKARNRPTRALIRDDVLVSIAKRRPQKAADLEVLRGFPQSHKSKIVRELLSVIKDGMSITQDKQPVPYQPRDESPMMKAVQSILSAYLRAVCHEEYIGHDLVGSTQRLNELTDYLVGESKTRPLLLTGWREKFIGRRLVDLLEGRSELHLSGWPKDLRLNVVSHPVED